MLVVEDCNIFMCNTWLTVSHPFLNHVLARLICISSCKTSYVTKTKTILKIVIQFYMHSLPKKGAIKCSILQPYIERYLMVACGIEHPKGCSF